MSVVAPLYAKYSGTTSNVYEENIFTLLFKELYLRTTLGDFIEIGKSFNFSVSEDQAKVVEKLIKNQASSHL